MKSTTKKPRHYPECNFGYAIFRETEEEGVIVASNLDHKKFQKGEDFWSAIKLPLNERRLIREACAGGGAYLIFSSLGVGILSTQYEMWAGYRVYTHLHSDPMVVKKTLSRMKHTMPFWQEVLSRDYLPDGSEKTSEAEFDADLALDLVNIEKLLEDMNLLCEERAEKGIKPCDFISIMAGLLNCRVNVQCEDKNPHSLKYHTLYPGLHRSMILLFLSLLRQNFGSSPIDVTVLEDEQGEYHLTMKMYAQIPNGVSARDLIAFFRKEISWFTGRFGLFSARFSFYTERMSEEDADLLMKEWRDPDLYVPFVMQAELPRDPSATPPGMMKSKPLLIMDNEARA